MSALGGWVGEWVRHSVLIDWVCPSRARIWTVCVHVHVCVRLCMFGVRCKEGAVGNGITLVQ